MYKFIRKVLIFLSCHILFRVKYENEDVLKNIDKCLICPNHSRVFDPFFIYTKIDNMYGMAKSELFKRKLVANFLKYHNIYPVDRNKADATVLKKTIKLIMSKEKIKFLIFPEGKVLKDKSERGIVKSGAIYIAMLSKVPIVPIYITARPKYFSIVKVKFGEPIYYDNIDTKDKEKIDEESKKLMTKIYELE